MSGFVVSRNGTFGVVHRRYTSDKGNPHVIIKWGPMGWLTPVLERDVKYLSSSFESEAKKEAEEWLAELERQGEAHHREGAARD